MGASRGTPGEDLAGSWGSLGVLGGPGGNLGAPGRPWGESWRTLGASRGGPGQVLGESWGGPGGSWGALGASWTDFLGMYENEPKPQETHYLGRSRGRPGGSRGALRPKSWPKPAPKNQPGGLLEAFWGVLGVSWRVPGESWRGLGASWGCLGGVLGRLGRLQGGPGPLKREVICTAGRFLSGVGPGGEPYGGGKSIQLPRKKEDNPGQSKNQGPKHQEPWSLLSLTPPYPRGRRKYVQPRFGNGFGHEWPKPLMLQCIPWFWGCFWPPT